MWNKMAMGQIFGLLLIAILTPNAKAEKIVVTGIAGQNVVLKCDLEHSTPAQIKWVDWVHNSGREPQLIFDSTKNSDRSVESSHPNAVNMEIDEDYSLTIKNLRLGNDDTDETGDSGEYICMSTLSDGTELEAMYEVNTMGDTPICSGDGDLKEGDRLDLKCFVPAKGSPPQLNWYMGDQKVEGQDMSIIGKAKKDYVVESASDVQDGQTFRCELVFGQHREECIIDVTVQYLVNDVKIKPETEEVHVDDEIQCSANGNPESKLQMSLEGADLNEIVDGESPLSVKIQKEWEGTMVKVKCSATNTLDGEEKLLETNKTYKVSAPPTTTTATTPTTTSTTTEKPTTVKAKPVKPKPTKRAPKAPKPDSKKDEPGTKTGGGNVVGIVAGVIIAALVIVVIVIAVVCIRRKNSKKHKGAKPVPTKEEEIRRLEDGKA